jgi:hypothetical protein
VKSWEGNRSKTDNYLELFSLDSGYPPTADSGMTDLMLARKLLSFSAAY